MNQKLKILNIFNHYLEKGGEAQAIELISESLAKTLDLRTCDFLSSDWIGSVEIYLEAKRLGIRVVQYTYNFRPFSLNGYLWA
jgi:hypothetical protein